MPHVAIIEFFDDGTFITRAVKTYEAGRSARILVDRFNELQRSPAMHAFIMSERMPDEIKAYQETLPPGAASPAPPDDPFG